MTHYFVGVFLILGGVAKVRDIKEFHRVVDSLGYFRRPTTSGFITLFIIAMEFILGSTIILQISHPMPALGAVAMIGCFTVAVILAKLRGRGGRGCGCFGAGSHEIGWPLLLRNAGLIFWLLAGTVTGYAILLVTIGALCLVVSYLGLDQAHRQHTRT